MSVRAGGRGTQALLERAAAVFPGGVLGSVAGGRGTYIPHEGSGSRFRDTEGREYVDYFLGAAALILGHSHPSIVAAVEERVRAGTHFFSDAQLNLPILELGEEICKTVPSAERIRFTTCGAEATFYALRLARAHTGRPKILKFEGAYHGHHDYGLRNFPSSLIEAAGVPDEVRMSVLTAPYNDIDAASDLIEANRTSLAAVIVDPVQRGLVPCPEFLSGLRRITQQFDICLIFDEVITGFWLGLGGAQQRFGVTPDLTALGKALGAGLPIGAVCGRTDIMELCNPARKGKEPFVYVGGTLNGYPLGAVASLAMLRELKMPGIFPQLEARAERLRAGMRDVFASHRLGAQVAGIGAISWVVFGDKPPVTYQDLMTRTDSALLREFDAKLAENGVAVGNRYYVSVVHTDEDIEITLKACDAAARGLRSR